MTKCWSDPILDAVVCLSSLRIGDGSTIATELGTGGGVDVDDVVGRYYLPFRNEKAGTIYRYLRLYTRVTGTVATGINYVAYVTKPAA